MQVLPVEGDRTSGDKQWIGNTLARLVDPQQDIATGQDFIYLGEFSHRYLQTTT